MTAQRTNGIVVILAICLSSPSLRAEEEAAEPPDIRNALSQWDQAQEALTMGERIRAYGLLESAFETYPNGLIACELGRVARRLSRRPTAVYWLRLCAADEDILPEIREAAALEAELVERQVGTLVVPRLPRWTKVAVDGQPRRIHPFRDLLLVPGSHEIELEVPSGRRWRGEVVIRPGERTLLEALVPIPEEPSVSPEQRHRSLRVAFWTTLAVSLTLSVGMGVAIGYDIQLSANLDPSAELARSTSGVFAGLTGLGLAAVFSLIPFVWSARRSAESPPSEDPSDEEASLRSPPPALRSSP